MRYVLLLIAFLALPALAFAQGATSTGPGFIALTNIPGLTDVGNAFDLQNFLNQLYRICIGAAAVIAVLQIMRAGIMYMGGDSVTEKKEAKNLIALSIGGLILVLSPVVVFSVINPEILSLKIGNIEGLKVPEQGATATTTATTTTGTTEQPQPIKKYGWRGRFENSSGAETTQQQGPFNTKSACDASLRDWPSKNDLASTGEFSCNCKTPISQQPSCSGF